MFRYKNNLWKSTLFLAMAFEQRCDYQKNNEQKEKSMIEWFINYNMPWI